VGTKEGLEFEIRPGRVVLVKENGKQTRWSLVESKGELWASNQGRVLRLDLKPKRSGASDGDSGPGLISQFPGKVRKVLVKQGDVVSKGDKLILMEAMKMEFAIPAPHAGVVAQIFVKEGDLIAPGTEFLKLEASPPGKEKNA
jgi:biotin carboxyl carrier protein